ncbi:hypothetical protein [Clostridium cylindrosporum]|uniref:Uncharacterized protein n=1 Tax=Clostridium cylindrosporum DSM 605 TaxID=1121307 RepID=A0A0J8DFS2_CLOCY|nr:hypothetical protein [Clostridium cylindrosporum]KMT23089.1 hypothetical protein CLCY_7c01360 [Clostridium cylindrosporum DSM 605]
MKTKIINVNFKCGKIHQNNDDRLENLHSSLAEKFKKSRMEFERIYSIERRIEGFIGFNQKDYEQKVGWSILGISIVYIYVVAILLNFHNSLFTVALLLVGEWYILGLRGKLFAIFKSIKLSKCLKSMSKDSLGILKNLILERDKIEKSIENNKYIEYKYLLKYIQDDLLRERFFELIEEYISTNSVDNLNQAAKYAVKESHKVNFGLRREF